MSTVEFQICSYGTFKDILEREQKMLTEEQFQTAALLRLIDARILDQVLAPGDVVSVKVPW